MADSETKAADGASHGAMDQLSAHLDRGWDLVHRGDLRGAELSARKSIELDAQSPEAHNLLGYVKAAQGAADDALEHYKQAIALDDTFVEAMLNAAEVLIHPLHDFDAAFGMVEEALDFAETDDDTADALLLKYDACVHKGDTSGAARVVATLPRGPFESPRLDFLVGRACFEAGLHAEGKRLLERAVSRNPHDAEAHYTLGLACEALSDPREMVRAFLRSRELDLYEPIPPWSPARDEFEALVAEAIARLPPPLRAVVDDAERIVAELPGAEVVADGLDPRAPLLLDTVPRGTGRGRRPVATRIFVYQRNVERAVEDPAQLAGEIAVSLEDEICATFPELLRHASPKPSGHEH